MIKELYIQKSSIIHGLNFWTKFLCFLLILPLTAFLSSAKALVLIAGIFFIFLSLSKISWQKFWQMTKIYIIPITIGVIILSLFFSPEIWQKRIIEGLILAIRFSLLISFGILFSAVTNPIEIPAGFLQAKIPHKYGITLMVGYRMMPLIAQKIGTVIDAQKARGAKIELSFKNLPYLPFIVTSLVVPILHSTLETSVRLSDTLIARDYNPEGKITTPPAKINFYDALIFSFSLLILIIGMIFK